ncbi:hypothetical protein SLEP1_g15107 [Rubroshorea leprosula]|uniref:Uncharacterized protein n=1 Tax=Rubroshorea leprosula TaxID=152421 RepID=A0AAV5IQM4_9ROSI|nr:hypothetical protein SLEP1_g15107 [Rubroshorea leprosula]
MISTCSKDLRSQMWFLSGSRLLYCADVILVGNLPTWEPEMFSG